MIKIPLPSYKKNLFYLKHCFKIYLQISNLFCKQINASYENNLFDCTAVMMRRL